MQHLGSLTGTGYVRVGEERLGPVHYTIRVYQVRHLKDGRGDIEGENADLWKIANADQAVLELEENGTVTILIDHLNALGNRASIVTSGSIPGF